MPIPAPAIRPTATRRNAIATLALRWRPGRAVPLVDYAAIEHAVWRDVARELAPLHERHACAEFRRGKARLGLPSDRIPQLDRGHLAAGAPQRFPLRARRRAGAAARVLREPGRRRFHSTQYVRHHSVPLYTPEPDVIHEVVGHANCLASERYAALYRAAGAAARRVQSAEALEFVSRVFWFSLEFGVLREAGELKVYGAGILSSYGELGDFQGMKVRPLRHRAMGRAEYDITAYQPVLYAARSFSHVEDEIGGFFAHCSDDSISQLDHRRVSA